MGMSLLNGSIFLLIEILSTGIIIVIDPGKAGVFTLLGYPDIACAVRGDYGLGIAAVFGVYTLSPCTVIIVEYLSAVELA